MVSRASWRRRRGRESFPRVGNQAFEARRHAATVGRAGWDSQGHFDRFGGRAYGPRQRGGAGACETLPRDTFCRPERRFSRSWNVATRLVVGAGAVDGYCDSLSNVKESFSKCATMVLPGSNINELYRAEVKAMLHRLLDTVQMISEQWARNLEPCS